MRVAAQLLRGRNRVKVVGICLGLTLVGCACSSPSSTSKGERVVAVGAENQYANVISQIGGRYVKVSAIVSNPNTDPHTFEPSPSVASAVSAAQLIVQNGFGYDSFMNTIEAASPNHKRKIVDVQKTLGLDSTPDPHLWYSPTTMPRIAKAIAADLSVLDRSHAAYFAHNLKIFDRSLTPWLQAISQFKARYPHTAVATTEPVADYMLEAAGTENDTPFSFQADIMNGVDPAPQDITLQANLLRQHKVKVLIYNEQVSDAMTQSFLDLANADAIPVVGVYETMPTPGYDYQTWMLAEVRALERAVADRISTGHL